MKLSSSVCPLNVQCTWNINEEINHVIPALKIKFPVYKAQNKSLLGMCFGVIWVLYGIQKNKKKKKFSPSLLLKNFQKVFVIFNYFLIFFLQKKMFLFFIFLTNYLIFGILHEKKGYRSKKVDNEKFLEDVLIK